MELLLACFLAWLIASLIFGGKKAVPPKPPGAPPPAGAAPPKPPAPPGPPPGASPPPK